MKDVSLETARNLMLSENHTCVLCKNEVLFTSDERGVKPLLKWLESDTDLSGFSASDKVVGKAAAFLYVLLGVKEVYALVMSEPAREVLIKNGIKTEFETLVPAIRNRIDTGFCPMETAVLGLDDPGNAYLAVKAKIKDLTK